MSLRLRLLIGIVALTAVGLIAFGAVNYRALEDHLEAQVDNQVEAAFAPLGTELARKAGIEPGPHLPGHGGQPGREPSRSDGPGPPGTAPSAVPPGTYGELRTGSGRTLAQTYFSYGGAAGDAPDLDSVPVSEPGHPPVIVSVRSAGSTRYRGAGQTGADGLVILAAVPTTGMDDTLRRMLATEAVVMLAVLGALALLAWTMISLSLRPLERMSTTADEITDGDLSLRVADDDPRNEVGRLGLALNTMLARIEDSMRRQEESQERMRRFLADASHELRTPLASIRGYAELFRIGAIPAGDETDRALYRIEAESARMGDLVNDLLTLARLEELPDPVREPVDLATLARECRDDTAAAAPDREITFDAEGPATVDGDPGQLRQMVTNLLRNAVAHTPADSVVEVTASGNDGQVILHVRDHGPGIPPGSEELIFERFWREGDSRSRDTGGAGIGLAIVAGVAGAHGGSCSVRNADDGGAIFEVRLPRSGSSQETSRAD